MKKTELIVKSREAMLAAVQLYNNPQITFKTESFISLSVIAWTYLLHAYYANRKIDYRYYHMQGKKKIYDRTKHGAYKHWELERCLDDKKSPIDSDTMQNLKFLIGLRHEIEHQMTKRIDASVSAKLQACSINYNYYIKKLFGSVLGVDHELGMVIQFSPIEAEQKEALLHNEKIADNVKNFITTFEDTLTEEEMGNTHYAYRVVFARVDGKRINGETDEVIRFVPAGSPQAQGLNEKYALIKETEKKKYLSKEIVSMMHEKGYSWFKVGEMTSFWKGTLKSRDKYGIYITKNQWMWYENWIPIIEKHCKEIQNKVDSQTEKLFYPKDIVTEINNRGYSRFTMWWLTKFCDYDLKIDRENSEYADYDKYHHIMWKESFIQVILEQCKNYENRLI